MTPQLKAPRAVSAARQPPLRCSKRLVGTAQPPRSTTLRRATMSDLTDELTFERAHMLAPDLAGALVDRYHVFLSEIPLGAPDTVARVEQAKLKARQWLVDAVRERYDQNRKRIVNALEAYRSAAASADNDVIRAKAELEQRIEQIKNTVRNAGQEIINALAAGGYALPDNFAADAEATVQTIRGNGDDTHVCQTAAALVLSQACRAGGVTI